MEALPQDFKFTLQEKLIELIWNQWCILGVQGNSNKKSSYWIDPESLILFTCTIGRREPRLFDEMLDWLNLYSDYINTQRLSSLIKSSIFAGIDVFSAVASSIRKSNWKIDELDKTTENEPLFFFKDGNAMPPFGENDTTFKNHGFIRAPLNLRGYSKLFDPFNAAALLMSLRGLFGVNARCEILLYLATHSGSVTVNPTQLSKELSFAQKTVHSILLNMSQSGFVQRNVLGKRTMYSLHPDFQNSLLLNIPKAPLWLNWMYIYSFLEKIYLKLFESDFDKTEPLIQIVELRTILKSFLPLLNTSGLQGIVFNEGPAEQSVFFDWFTKTIQKIIKMISE